MRKYRIIEDSSIDEKVKIYRPQYKSFLFWHNLHNFSEFKGIYIEENCIYDNLEDAKKRIDKDIHDGELEKELKASRKLRKCTIIFCGDIIH